MSQQNVEVVRHGYERFKDTGRFVAELVTPNFTWDMSNFRGWPEQQIYEGPEGAQSFIDEWSGAWDDWELRVDALLDAGERVVALISQRGRSKATGLPVDMSFAQVWTLRDGKQTRMDMYSDRGEALRATGLPG
jgi:ketosteroid isomerase-like protein